MSLLSSRSKDLQLQIIFTALTALISSKAYAQEIAPFKDELFATKRLTSAAQVKRQEQDAVFRNRHIRSLVPASTSPAITWADPNFRNILYHKQTHLYGWDEIPVKKAKDQRVEVLPPTAQKEITWQTPAGPLNAYQVGNLEKAKFAVIFIHGGGGDKTLGVNDWSFGGNFNRLKNLAVKNQGVYYSPTVQHNAQGVESIGALMAQIKQRSPNSKIVLACGSAGGAICTGIAENQTHSKYLNGIIHLGSARAPLQIAKTPAAKQRIPTLFAHGSYDFVYTWEDMKKNYDALRADPTYPVRFDLFHGGVHGTPIRMIDWRDSLNWIFANQPHVNDQSTDAPETSVE